jgi:hypothetical protein
MYYMYKKYNIHSMYNIIYIYPMLIHKYIFIYIISLYMSCPRRHVVVMPSSCRRSIVVVLSAHRRQVVFMLSSCRRSDIATSSS